jgi:hypothetical protein
MRRSALAFATAAALVSANFPTGWRTFSSQPASYEIGIDAVGCHAGKGSGYIRSIAKVEPGKFGTMMQNIKADKYRGKNVKLSAYMRTSAEEDGAWLWLRIDEKESLTLDNMNDRLVKGTTDWKHYELVLPVSGAAIGIAFGIGLTGTGQAWIDDITLEAVEANVSRTGNLPELRNKPGDITRSKILADYASRPAAGINLDFEQ